MYRSIKGTECQACGAFRRVGINGKLPPHKCAAPRQPMPKSAARKVIVIPDDDLAAYIRTVCYGTTA